jgi:manganese efflux pump family protein
MLELIASAVAVGLGNFGAAIGIGLSGSTTSTRVRVGLVFGAFEGGMPVVGLLVGHGTAHALGAIAAYVGGGLLLAMGVWQLVQTFLARGTPSSPPRGTWRLLLTGFALSMDNLVVGFTLGVQNTPLFEAIVVFAVVSAALSLLGLELGKRLGAAIGSGVEYVAGFVLIGVGVLVAVGEI